MNNSLQQAAREFVGKSGFPGDAWNNVFPIQLQLDGQREKIKPAKTYADYMHNVKYRDNHDIADAIVEATDPDMVAKHNDIVSRLNAVIGEGVTTEVQVETIKVLLDEMRTLIYG